MITTLLSLYVTAALYGNELPAPTAQTLSWNDSTLLTATAIPQKKPENVAPVINAKSAIAVDLKSGYILYEKNIYESRPIASLTKLMTAVILLEENNLGDTATISNNTTKTPGSKIWLTSGEKITVENLLYGALINSANDAAVALAEYNSGNVTDFVKKMNLKSKELGLYSTTFTNPTGLDLEKKPDQNAPQGGSSQSTTSSQSATQKLISSQTAVPLNQAGQLNPAGPPGDNYSTAYDLSLLGRYAFGKSFIRRAAIKKEFEITSTNGKLKHKLKNTNELLGSYLNVLGLKTGTTDQAGECLIGIIENEKQNQILTIVLDSPDRYKETKILADWVYRSYTW